MLGCPCVPLLASGLGVGGLLSTPLGLRALINGNFYVRPRNWELRMYNLCVAQRMIYIMLSNDLDREYDPLLQNR